MQVDRRWIQACRRVSTIQIPDVEPFSTWYFEVKTCTTSVPQYAADNSLRDPITPAIPIYLANPAAVQLTVNNASAPDGARSAEEDNPSRRSSGLTDTQKIVIVGVAAGVVALVAVVVLFKARKKWGGSSGGSGSAAQRSYSSVLFCRSHNILGLWV